MRRVAFFGGSFNPPHVSHVLAAAYVLMTEAVDELLVVPTFAHPFGKALTPFEHRVAMCEAAFGDVRRVRVSTIEQEMGGASRTLYTLQELKRRNPEWDLRLVIGSDILAETHKWFAWDEVTAIAPPIVLARVGYPTDGAAVPVLPEVASRDLRAALAAGETVKGFVPEAVRTYIDTHKLYRGSA